MPRDTKFYTYTLLLCYKTIEYLLTSGWSLTGTNTFSVMVTGAPSGSGSTSGSFFTPFTSNRLARTLVISVTTKITWFNVKPQLIFVPHTLTITEHQYQWLWTTWFKRKKEEAARWKLLSDFRFTLCFWYLVSFYRNRVLWKNSTFRLDLK